VYLLDCKIPIQPGETKRVELSRLQIQRISPGAPIHGLFNIKVSVSRFFWKNFVIAALETEDNQLDFSQIIPIDFGTEKFTY
jgi:hypothetical protein